MKQSLNGKAAKADTTDNSTTDKPGFKNRIAIQKIFARLLGTEDISITPKEYWKDDKRPDSAMMNLWVAAHALFKGCSPQDIDNHAPSDNEAAGPSGNHRHWREIGRAHV